MFFFFFFLKSLFHVKFLLNIFNQRNTSKHILWNILEIKQSTWYWGFQIFGSQPQKAWDEQMMFWYGTEQIHFSGDIILYSWIPEKTGSRKIYYLKHCSDNRSNGYLSFRPPQTGNWHPSTLEPWTYINTPYHRSRNPTLTFPCLNIINASGFIQLNQECSTKYITVPL